MYNYFFITEIIRTARSIIPSSHLRKTGISVPPYVFILKEYYYGLLLPIRSLGQHDSDNWDGKKGKQIVMLTMGDFLSV